MKDFFEIRKSAAGLMEESAKMLEGAGYGAGSENVRKAIEKMNEKKMVIVTVGEIKRGKSSLINALLEEADLMPVDADVATNAITIAEYAEEEQIFVYFAGNEEPKKITRGEIAEYVSEGANPDNYKGVETVRVYIPNEFLKKGIVLVDTPGVGSRNIAHAEATNAFLPMADLLIFTGDALSEYSETEINFLKRGYKYCKNVVFPITKKDLAVNYEQIADDDRKKIHNALGIEPDKIRLIPLSSRLKLRYMETGRESQYKNSNFEEFERVMWNAVAETRVEKCIVPFLEAALSELTEAGSAAAAEYEMLVTEDKKKVQDIINGLERQKNEYALLQMGGAKWESDVLRFSQDAKKEWKSSLVLVQNDADKHYETEIHSKGDTACQEKECRAIFASVNDILILGLEDAKAEVVESLEETSVRLVRDLGLDMNVNSRAFEENKFTPKKFETLFPNAAANEKTMKVGKFMMAAGTAATIGGCILGAIGGTFVAPGGGTIEGIKIGANIGKAAGAALGALGGIVTNGCTNAGALQVEFRKYVEGSVTSMQEGGAPLIEEMGNELKRQFKDSLKKRENDLQESIKNMTENLRLSPKESEEKTKEMKARCESFSAEINKVSGFLEASAQYAAE